MPVLGLFELIAIGIFFILMVIGTALDRRYSESPKWWILGLGIAAAVTYFWKDLDFSSLLTAVSTWSFWAPFATYLAAGLIYSVLEFVLSVRKMARKHAASWDKFISTTVKKYFIIETNEEVSDNWVKQLDGKLYISTTNNGLFARNGTAEKEVRVEVTAYRDIFKRAMEADASADEREQARRLLYSYMTSNEYQLSDLKRDFVQVELNKDTFVVQPAMNRGRLASFIGAWTFLWPAYAVSLILGDFLVEIFRMIGDAFAKLGGRFVRMSFDGVFKV